MNSAIKTLIFFLAITLPFQFISAIGIGPGSTNIDFSPGLTQDLTFVALNNGGYDMVYNIYTAGELAPYINCSEKSLTMEVGDKKYFSCKLSLPDQLSPGAHIGKVGIVEYKGKQAGQVSVLAAVESRITVSVSYPDFYLALSISADNVKINEKETFNVTVKNWGKDNVTLKIPIQILSSEGQIVSTAITNEETIAPLKETKLFADWTANVPSGKYTAFADYQGFNASKEFLVGDFLINIVNFTTDVTEGELGKFELSLQSMWPEPITFKSKIEVLDGLGNSMGVKDDEFIIRSWESGLFKILWENPLNASNDYTAKVTVLYGNKTAEKNFNFEVKKKSAISSIDGNKMLIYALSIVIIGLVGVIFYNFIRNWRIKNNRKDITIKHHSHTK
jgi:hypothetical protein